MFTFQPGRKDYYRLTLNISQLDQEEIARTHEVSIITKETTRTVSFELATRKSGVQTQTVRKEKERLTYEIHIFQMSIGFIIIIVSVVVVVILICICCFFYRRKKTGERERKDSVLYSPVTTNNPPKP